MTDRPAALELIGVSKAYGSVIALDAASLTVRPGTVHAVLGENGAGKTSLMQIAYGTVRADTGRIRVGGRDVRITSPLDALAARIGMVHQHYTLVPAMSVGENLALGGQGRLRSSDMAARVREIAERTGFGLDPEARVQDLPVGAQQRVEIAKALARRATLLILDEPTAVLAPAEIDDLLRWLRAYVDAGNAAVIITHKLREALAVADDVTVLRRGRVVHAESVMDSSEGRLLQAMLGEDKTAPASTVAGQSVAAVVFRADHLSVADRSGRLRVRDATFSVRGGELVGIAGVEGAGHRELLRALAGRVRPASGTLDRPAAVGFVPEDRHHDAVLLERSLTENIALRGAGRRRGHIDWGAMAASATRVIETFDVRASAPSARMRTLSGGNQQKLILARELSATDEEPAPDALVVENPTRGLDVRATASVHRHLLDACARSAAVVLYSSDLDEVLALASRVLVICDGVVSAVPRDRDAVGRAMLGLS